MFGITDAHKLKPLRRASTPRAKRSDVLKRHRVILSTIRDRDGATTTEIAEAVAPLFKLNADHEPESAAVLSGVRKILHRLEHQGGVRRDGWRGDARVWRVQK